MAEPEITTGEDVRDEDRVDALELIVLVESEDAGRDIWEDAGMLTDYSEAISIPLNVCRAASYAYLTLHLRMRV